jgi:hypothetical protein
MTALEEKLRAEMLAACRETVKLGYVPTHYLRMITDLGPVETARRLVTSGELHTSFRKLAKLGKLDLTIEAIMTRPEFASLFKPAEIAAAQWRLNAVGGAGGGAPAAE